LSSLQKSGFNRKSAEMAPGEVGGLLVIEVHPRLACKANYGRTSAFSFRLRYFIDQESKLVFEKGLCFPPARNLFLVCGSQKAVGKCLKIGFGFTSRPSNGVNEML
jgi:hypothetical protein